MKSKAKAAKIMEMVIDIAMAKTFKMDGSADTKIVTFHKTDNPPIALFIDGRWAGNVEPKLIRRAE